MSTLNARLTPIALKASAGASESLQLLSVHNTSALLNLSKNNGWEVYAAVAPPDLDNPQTKQDRRYLFATQLSKPLLGSPCLLLLGEEGAGLRRDLVQKADHLISIGGPRRGQAGLDSLNVSVAAALLCEAFLRKPSEPSSLPDYPTLGVDGDERLF